MAGIPIDCVLWFAANKTKMCRVGYDTRREARVTLPGSDFTYAAKVRLKEILPEKRRKR